MPKTYLHRRSAALAVVATVYATGGGAAPGTVTNIYDDLGRLRSSSYSDGRLADYQYDKAGNRTANTAGVPPTLAISGPANPPVEGSPLVFTVTKIGISSSAITVTCAQSDGSAKSGGAAPFDDYTSASQTITFAASEGSPATRPCAVNTKDDSFYEGSQTVVGSLQNSSAGTAIVTSSAIGTIADNDPAPVFSVEGSTKSENASPLTFSITKAGLTELDHNASYSTEDGTASIADGDYSAVSGNYTFPAATPVYVISVPIINDARFELNENMAMRLSAPSNGATLGTSAASSTITNDDQPPSVAISDAVVVDEGNVSTFTATKSGSSALSHSFNWATANNNAQQPGDYIAASGVITFAVSETSKTIQVQTKTDGLAEGTNETYFVNLSEHGSTNAATISDGQGVGTIADIDGATPSVPANLRITPTGNAPTYSVAWNASTGGVAYYLLEETFNGNVGAPINTSSTSKAYSAKPSGNYDYRVRACNSANVCSIYSANVSRLVCNGACD